MGNIIQISNQNLTMSSREIAELVEKRHDNVKRTIETLAERGVVKLPQFEEVKNHLGQTVTEYRVGKRDSYIVVAQLCPEFTARLVDRWQELEAQVSSPAFALPDFSNPAAAARAWAEQFELREAANKELAIAAPKVEHFDRYVSRDSLHNMTACAKEMGMSGVRLGRLVREHGIAYKRTDKLVWMQWFIDKGYGVMKQYTANEHDGSQAMLTNEGDAYLKAQFGSEVAA